MSPTPPPVPPPRGSSQSATTLQASTGVACHATSCRRSRGGFVGLYWRRDGLVFEGAAFVGGRIGDQTIHFSTFVAIRQIFRNRHPIFPNKKETMTVFVDLHFVAGADPPSELGFGFFVLVKIARAEWFPEFVDMGR